MDNADAVSSAGHSELPEGHDYARRRRDEQNYTAPSHTVRIGTVFSGRVLEDRADVGLAYETCKFRAGH